MPSARPPSSASLPIAPLLKDSGGSSSIGERGSFSHNGILLSFLDQKPVPSSQAKVTAQLTQGTFPKKDQKKGRPSYSSPPTHGQQNKPSLQPLQNPKTHFSQPHNREPIGVCWIPQSTSLAHGISNKSTAFLPSKNTAALPLTLHYCSLGNSLPAQQPIEINRSSFFQPTARNNLPTTLQLTGSYSSLRFFLP